MQQHPTTPKQPHRRRFKCSHGNGCVLRAAYRGHPCPAHGGPDDYDPADPRALAMPATPAGPQGSSSTPTGPRPRGRPRKHLLPAQASGSAVASSSTSQVANAANTTTTGDGVAAPDDGNEEAEMLDENPVAAMNTAGSGGLANRFFSSLLPNPAAESDDTVNQGNMAAEGQVVPAIRHRLRAPDPDTPRGQWPVYRLLGPPNVHDDETTPGTELEVAMQERLEECWHDVYDLMEQPDAREPDNIKKLADMVEAFRVEFFPYEGAMSDAVAFLFGNGETTKGSS